MSCYAQQAKVMLSSRWHVSWLIILLATAVIGAVEELAQSNRTISLVDEIFEINFFANVNIIKAVLPVMRDRKNGHIIVITGISMLSRSAMSLTYADQLATLEHQD